MSKFFCGTVACTLGVKRNTALIQNTVLKSMRKKEIEREREREKKEGRREGGRKEGGKEERRKERKTDREKIGKGIFKSCPHPFEN